MEFKKKVVYNKIIIGFVNNSVHANSHFWNIELKLLKIKQNCWVIVYLKRVGYKLISQLKRKETKVLRKGKSFFKKILYKIFEINNNLINEDLVSMWNLKATPDFASNEALYMRELQFDSQWLLALSK